MPTQAEFITSIRQKYPQYQDIDDSTLVAKIVEKYPVYKDQISDFGQSSQPISATVRDAPTFQPSQRIILTERQEALFQDAWKNDPNIVTWKQDLGVEDKSPDDPEEKYDYRKAWLSGDLPQVKEDDGKYHWGSVGKDIDHPTYDKQFSISNMKPLQAGEIIDESDGWKVVKERKMQALIDARNSWIQGSYQLVDIAGGALIWSGLNEELGTRIRKFGKEVLKDYQVAFLTKEFKIEDLKNPAFYYTKGVQMIPMLLTLIPTALVAGSGGGAAVAALGLGKLGIGVTAAVTSALASRPLESIMEAIGTYNEMIDSGESKEKAGEAAADVFQKNMSLIGMDAGQYALAFIKVHPAFRKPMSNWIAKTGVKAVGFAAGSVSEGFEEVIQNYFQELGKASARGETPPDLLKALTLATPEQKEAFALGTLAGTGFQAVRTIQESRIKDEVITPEEADQIVEEVIAIAEEKTEEAKIEETKKAEPVTEPIIEPVVEKPKEPEKAEIKPKVEKTVEEEIIEPVQPVEGRKAAEPEIEKPTEATTENIDEFLGQEIEKGKLGKDDTGYFVEKTGEKNRIAPSQAINYVNEAIKPEKLKEAPIVPKVEEKPAEAKPPAKKPIVEPTIKAKRVATVEEIEKSRKKYGLADIPLDETRKWINVFKKAEKRKPETLAIVHNFKEHKPRVLTNEEFATLVLSKTEIEDLLDESQSNVAKAIDSGNVKEQERHTAIMENALNDLDEITDVIRFSNREAGRALNIIQVALKKEGELYKVSKILQMAKVAKGVKLTAQEINELSELGRKIDIFRKRESALIKDIEALQEKLSKQDAIKTFVKTAKTAPRKRSQAILKTEREDLFNDLNKIGYRLNDVIGLTYESATIVSKLAINYFESGVKELDAIVEKIQTKVPDLSKKNVYDSIGGRIKKTKKAVVSTTKQEIADLKTQARLMGEIEDAYDGVFEQSKKRKVSSTKILNLQKKLKELKSKANQTVKDDEKLNKILLRIDNVQDQLITGARDIRKTKRADSPDIQNAKQELSELRRLISAKDKIADLENQLETGNFKVPVKIQTVIKSTDLLSVQVKLTQLRREVREHIHAMQPRTKREMFIEIITLPRLLMSIADISMVRRQAGPIGARHPIQAIKFQPASLKALFSQNKADEIDVWIRKHENQPIREQAGLFLSSIEGPISKKEEYFISSLGEKIPVWGKVIRASNRHAVTYLNFMRAIAFDQFLETYPNATTEELMVWARLINISSGRGDLGAFNKVADELSVALFSPRFSTSRVQLPFEALRHKNWKHPSIRKEMSKHIMSYISLTGTVLFLASLAGVKVDTDPNDPDFLKMRIGDTTIDIFSGFLQPMRVIILAILTALETAGVARIKGNRDLRAAIERFIRYKEAPSITIPFELVTGTTAIGEETTPVKTIARHVTPLAMQDIIDTYKSEPLLLPIIVPLALVGEGINTYKRRRRSVRKSIKK